MKKPNKLMFLALSIVALGLSACGAQPGSSSEEPPAPSSSSEAPSSSESTSQEPEFIAPEFISLVGSIGEGSHWATDYDLTSTDGGHNWIIEDFLMLQDQEWKVRMNHDWGTAGVHNWGYSNLDDASKELFTDNGGNVKVGTSAYYTVAFDYDEMVISVTKGADYHATVVYDGDTSLFKTLTISNDKPAIGEKITIEAVAALDYVLYADSIKLNGNTTNEITNVEGKWTYSFVISELENVLTGAPTYAIGDYAFAAQTEHQNRQGAVGEVDGKAAVGLLNNEGDLLNILVKDAGDLKDQYAYTMSATFTTQEPAPNDMDEPRNMGYGFVPYYVDDDNWFSVYLNYWTGDRPYEVRTVSIDGRIGGELLHDKYGWTEAWADGSAFNPQNGVELTVTRARGEYKVTASGTDDSGTKISIEKVINVNADLAKVQTQKIGFHAYGCGLLTVTNLETKVEEDKRTEGYVKVNGNWGGSSSYYVNSKDELVYNLGSGDNWKSGMVLVDNDDVKGSTKYSVSATVTSSVGAPISAINEMHIGFCVYYVDDANFLNAYLQWHRDEKGGWIRQMNIVGTINGNDSGWNDIWAFDLYELDPSEAFSFSFSRDGDTFTFTAGERTGTCTVNSTCANLPATNKVGVWGNMNGLGGTLTYSNLTVTNNA